MIRVLLNLTHLSLIKLFSYQFEQVHFVLIDYEKMAPATFNTFIRPFSNIKEIFLKIIIKFLIHLFVCLLPTINCPARNIFVAQRYVPTLSRLSSVTLLQTKYAVVCIERPPPLVKSNTNVRICRVSSKRVQ